MELPRQAEPAELREIGPKPAEGRAVERDVDEDVGRLTFSQYFRARKGYYDPLKARADPEYDDIVADFRGYADVPARTEVERLQKAVLEVKYRADSGESPGGQSLTPGELESDQRFLATLQDRLKAARGRARKGREVPAGPPTRGSGATPEAPVSDALELKQGPRAVAAEAAPEAALTRALREKDAVYEIGRVLAPGDRQMVESGWVGMRTPRGEVIYDPLYDQWMTREFFQTNRRPELSQRMTKAQVQAFKERTGELPTLRTIEDKAGVGAVTAERGIVGKPVKIGMRGAKDKVDAEWELADGRRLVTSHTDDFRENPPFPQPLQQRLRGKQTSREQISDIERHLDVTELGQSPKDDTGAPTTGPDYVVESGNGRMLLLRRLWKKGGEGWREYVAFLREELPALGIDPASVDRMLAAGKMPVLIRRRTAQLSMEQRVELAERWNIPATAERGATEVALSDSQKMDRGLLDMLQPVQEGDPFTAGVNRDFVKAFSARVIPTEERPRFADPQGTLSADGARRIRNAIFAYAYGGKDPSQINLVTRLAETVNPEMKRMVTALTRLGPRVSRFKAAAEAGEAYPEADISGELSKSVRTLADIANNPKQSVENWLRHEDLVNPISPEHRLLVEAIYARRRSSKEIETLVNAYLRNAEAAGNPKQMALFGEPGPPQRLAMLKAAVEESIGPQNSAGSNQQLGFSQKVGGDALADDGVRALRAQAKVARIEGKTDLAQTLEAEADLLAAGKKPPGGGVDTSREGLEAKWKALMQRAGVKDPRIEKEIVEDVPRWLTYLATPEFVARHSRQFLAVPRLYQTAQQKMGRLRHMLITERVPRKLRKPLSELRRDKNGYPVTQKEGFRPVWSRVSRKEKPKLIEALWEGEEPRFKDRMHSVEELKARGLSDEGIIAYYHTRRLLKHALDHIINPLRKRLGLKPVAGRNNYLPHKWFGIWELRDAAGKPIMTPTGSTFDSEIAAYEAAVKILRAHPDAKVNVGPSYYAKTVMEELPDSLEAATMARFLKAWEKQGHINTETLLAAMKAGIAPRGMPVHFRQRRGLPGFEKSLLPQVIEQYLSQLSRYAPMRIAREDAQAIMERLPPDTTPQLRMMMQRYIDQLHGSQSGVEQAVDSILKNIPIVSDYLGIRPTRVAARQLRTATAHAKLGLLNVGFALVNASQFISHVTPMVGTEYAAKGLKMYWKAKGNPDSPEGQLYAHLVKRGIVRPAFLEAETGGPLGSASHASFLFSSQVEEMNRGAGSMAAWARLVERGLPELPKHLQGKTTSEVRAAYERLLKQPESSAIKAQRKKLANDVATLGLLDAARGLGLKPGKSVSGDRLVRLVSNLQENQLEKINRRSVDAAMEMFNDATNFQYSVAHRPEMFRGPFGELIGQFKQFPVATAQLWKRSYEIARLRPRPLAPGEEAGPFREFEKVPFVEGIKAGDYNPLLGHFGSVLLLSGVAGFPLTMLFDRAIQVMTGERFSPLEYLFTRDIHPTVMRGLPALAHLDASRRLGAGDIVPITLTDFFTGPAVDTIGNAVGHLIRGDVDMMAREIAPGFSNPYMAYKMLMDETVRERNTRARPRYHPSTADVVARAVGFRPLLEARLSDQRRAQRRKEKAYKWDRGVAIDTALDILDTMKGAERTEAYREHLKDVRAAGITITAKDLRDERIRKRQPQLERAAKMVPKALRREYLQETRGLRQEELQRMRERPLEKGPLGALRRALGGR